MSYLIFVSRTTLLEGDIRYTWILPGSSLLLQSLLHFSPRLVDRWQPLSHPAERTKCQHSDTLAWHL